MSAQVINNLKSFAATGPTHLLGCSHCSLHLGHVIESSRAFSRSDCCTVVTARLRVRLAAALLLLEVLDSLGLCWSAGARTGLVGSLLFCSKRAVDKPGPCGGTNHFTFGWTCAVDLSRAVMRSRGHLAQHAQQPASGSSAAVRPPMEYADAMRVANQNGSLGRVDVLILELYFVYLSG